MTQRDGSVDWDLLADHLGGALDGTPEGARVAQLVATDPGWATAAAELSTALGAVAADLHALPAPTMPDDIAARLADVLSSPPPVRPAADASPHRSPAPGHSLDASRPGSAGGSRRPPGRPGDGAQRQRRRRLARWGAGLLVAAGVAGFAAIGLNTLDINPSQVTADGAGEADDSADLAQAPEEESTDQPSASSARGAPADPLVITMTGIDYEPPTLASTEAEPEEGAEAPKLDDAEAEPNTAAPPPSVAIDTDDVPPGVPPDLDRLWADPQAREACLAAIAATLEPAPVTIDTVDFARFEGEDALVMWATAQDGTRWAIAAGPDCGTSGVGPDERFRTQVS